MSPLRKQGSTPKKLDSCFRRNDKRCFRNRNYLEIATSINRSFAGLARKIFLFIFFHLSPPTNTQPFFPRGLLHAQNQLIIVGRQMHKKILVAITTRY